MTSKETYHFYLEDGTAAHGTIEEAKERNALASVTTVLSNIRKEFVEKYQMREAIKASWCVVRNPDEEEKAYLNRCLRHVDIKGRLITDFGTLVHSAYEDYNLRHKEWTDGKISHAPNPEEIRNPSDEEFRWLVRYHEWFGKNVKRVLLGEKTAVSLTHRYAGTIDAVIESLSGRLAILDYKTQNRKVKLPFGNASRRRPAGPPAPTEYWPANFYETWLLQLCAYRKSLREQYDIDVTRLVSIVINSNEPAPLEHKCWNHQEYDAGMEAFLNCLNLWKWLNQFN
jgi:hypothetical protein